MLYRASDGLLPLFSCQEEATMATDLSEQTCPQCQQPIAQGATTCPKCGLVFSGEADPAGADQPLSAAAPPASSDTADETLPAAVTLEETLPDAPPLEASAGQPPDAAAAALSGMP